MLHQAGKRSDWITGINAIMQQKSHIPMLSSAVVKLIYISLSSIHFNSHLYDVCIRAGILMVLLLLLKQSDSLASKK